MPLAGKIYVLEQNGVGFETEAFIKLIIIYVSGLIYIPLAFFTLLKYKKTFKNQFSNTEKINFNWLLTQIIGTAFIWIVVLFVRDDRFIFGFASLLVFWKGFFGIKQANVFGNQTPINIAILERTKIANAENISKNLSNNEILLQSIEESETLKYQNSALEDAQIQNIYNQLVAVLEKEKPFLNPELNLGELAKIMKIHPNILSQVINTKTNNNFYDLINERRIREFLSKATLALNKHFTLVALAFDSGFNSKASFNRNFKKHLGKSPSDYLEKIN